MSKEYYKVVYKSGDRLMSCIYDHALAGPLEFKKKYAVEYIIDKWVRPNIDKTDLMCFSSLDSARDFLKFEGNLAYCGLIYRCQVKNPRKQGLFFPLTFKTLERDIQKVRQRRELHKSILNYVVKPYHDNVVFCSSIKLIERVY